MSAMGMYLAGGVKRLHGRDLTKTRDVIGITAAEFAQMLGMSRSSLYRLEENKDGELPFPVTCTLYHIRRRFKSLYLD